MKSASAHRLGELIADPRVVVAMTGAGVSVSINCSSSETCGGARHPLVVYPVAPLPPATFAAVGGRIAIVTHGPTPFDDRAAVRCNGDVIDELVAVIELPDIA